MTLEQELKHEQDQFMNSPFPECEALGYFKEHTSELLKKYSPHSLKLKVDEYKDLSTAKEYTYKHVAALLNFFMIQSMSSLHMEDLDEYCKFCTAMEEAHTRWNKDVKPVQERIQRKANALSETEKKSGRKLDFPVKTDKA